MLLLGLCAFLFNVLPKAALNKYLNGPKKLFVGFFFNFNSSWGKNPHDVAGKIVTVSSL